MLAKLTAASANHFNVDPDSVNWGHVGNLSYLLERLGDGARILAPD